MRRCTQYLNEGSPTLVKEITLLDGFVVGDFVSLAILTVGETRSKPFDTVFDSSLPSRSNASFRLTGPLTTPVKQAKD